MKTFMGLTVVREMNSNKLIYIYIIKCWFNRTILLEHKVWELSSNFDFEDVPIEY